MSYRFMRIIVFFDLPVTTLEGRRNYTAFRKFLIRSGFIMMQESVYCKLALNAVTAGSIMEHVRRNSPQDGLIQMLMVTEKQYNNIEYIIGENSHETIDSSDRLVVL